MKKKLISKILSVVLSSTFIFPAFAIPSKKAVNSKTQKTQNVKKATVKNKTPTKKVSTRKIIPAIATVPIIPTFIRLEEHSDFIKLRSKAALVIDQDSEEILLSKNDDLILPIASITKLMAGLITAEANLPMDEIITITKADIVASTSRSRLQVGSKLTREELLNLSLMSSENRATQALARTYPTGLKDFILQMNLKAKLLGMSSTSYVEPTGISNQNRSSANDLVKLVNVAYENPVLREFSTLHNKPVRVNNRTVYFSNSNQLVHKTNWDIGLQKTGFISSAGRCMVIQTRIADRNLIMVFLNSQNIASRVADAENVKDWIVNNLS